MPESVNTDRGEACLPLMTSQRADSLSRVVARFL